jgi:hypothetical protein
MYSIQKILYLNLSELAYFYLSLDNGVMMTSKRRFTNFVSLIFPIKCLKRRLFIKTTCSWGIDY